MGLTRMLQPLIALIIHVTKTLCVKILFAYKKVLGTLIAITPLIVQPATQVLSFIVRGMISSLLSLIVMPTLGATQIGDKIKGSIVMTFIVKRETFGVMSNIMAVLALIPHNLTER